MQTGIQKGWFPPLPEVDNRRSMIHVDDLVQSLMLVAEDDRANGEIYETICAVLGKSVPQWSVPRIIFDIVSRMNPHLHYRVDKLLGDECYSSKKLQSLGFKAQRSLREINETDF